MTEDTVRLRRTRYNPVVATKRNEYWQHFLAGGIGGMTGTLLTSPLDVVKTRLQSDFYRDRLAVKNPVLPVAPSFVQSGLRHFKETCQILVDVYRVEGGRALFKGLGPNLIGVVPARAINFFVYGNGKLAIARRYNDSLESSWVHLSAAALAGIATSTATNPIWLIKTRLQLDREHSQTQSRRYRNSLDCVKQVLRQEGVSGLYRGMSASYLGVTESTMQWVLYERMKMSLTRRREARIATGMRIPSDDVIDWVGKLSAAGVAKLFAAAITYPHEVVRTRLRQAPLENGYPKYSGLVQCFRLVLKEEGISALYGGMTPHLMRVVPNAAVMFGSYELILKLFQ